MTDTERSTPAPDHAGHDHAGHEHDHAGHDHAGHDHAPDADRVWHRDLRVIRSSDLTGQTNQTTGMTRYEAISGKTVGSEKLWTGETHVGPATNSGDHHHGEAETSIYVVSGHPVFVFAQGDEEIKVETNPGDYVFVPPYLPHREENPSDEPAVVVISRTSQEGIVVNLPSLWAPVDRPDAG